MTKILERNGKFEVHESDVETVATTITLAGLSARLPNSFIGVQFFSDSAGTTFADPGAGTVLIEAEHFIAQDYFQTEVAALDATDPVVHQSVGNLSRVRATPTGLTTATHWKLVVSQNLN